MAASARMVIPRDALRHLAPRDQSVYLFILVSAYARPSQMWVRRGQMTVVTPETRPCEINRARIV